MQVITFVSETLMVKESRLNARTTLLYDLGVDGGDGDDFLFEFSERFGVDFTGIDLSLHFGPEGMPLPFLGPEPKMLIPITLGGLADAMARGRWVTPSQKPL
jgi:hypothetical protein